MRPNRLIELFRNGETAIAGWISCDSAFVAELAGCAGFDAVVIDLQHGLAGFEKMVALLQALSYTPAVPMVRVSKNDLAEINRALDAGAYGVVCPLVDSAEAARTFARACRYPPRGDRSYGPSRALLYGGVDYAQHADAHIIALAMIETRAALDAVDAIAAVDGIDGLFVGPSDLGIALGLGAGAPHTHPALAAAIATILDSCRRVGKPCGIWCSTAEMARDLRDAGFAFVVPGHDALWLKAEMARRLAVLGRVPT